MPTDTNQAQDDVLLGAPKSAFARAHRVKSDQPLVEILADCADRYRELVAALSALV